MSTNNAAETVVAANGQVYVAPTLTPLPVDPTAPLDPAFVGLGYISEDGATLTVAPDITDFNAWQSRQPIRREMTAQALSVAFGLLQFNEDTVVLAWGGGTVSSPSAGVYRFDFPASGDALDERAMVIDAEDGDTHMRFVFPRGNAAESVETQLNRTSMGLLPITFQALEPEGGGSAGYFLSDSVAFAPGS